MAAPSFNQQFSLLIEPRREPARIRPVGPAVLPPLERPLSPVREDVAQLRRALPPTLAAQISSGSELIRTLARERRDEPILTRIPALDTLAGGLQRGKVLELYGRRSSGRFAMVIAALAAATSTGEAAALIDLGDHLDPQHAQAAGADLSRMLWVRPHTTKQALAATEIVIATGFALVVLDLGLQLRGRRADEIAWVRLARAAEAHGAALVVSSPFHLGGTIPEAVLAAGDVRANWQGTGRTPRLLLGISSRITLEKHRRKRAGETGAMRLLASDTIREKADAVPLLHQKPAKKRSAKRTQKRTRGGFG